MEKSEVILDEEFDKFIKTGLTANFETREGLADIGKPISKEELSAYEKALRVTNIDNLTKEEKERATRQANKIIEAFNKTKEKVGRCLALAIVCSVIAVTSFLGATISFISYEDDKQDIKNIALSEESIQKDYNEKISKVKAEFEEGNISKDEYAKKIEEVSESFDYWYLRNAVIYKAQNTYVKRAVREIDADANMKLRGLISGYMATAAALGGAISSNKKRKKYAYRSKMMNINRKDAEQYLKCSTN